ncbi:MAG TPA: sorbosone dehydrogenase family protein, partial [Chitinophagaceae bacterium]
VIPDISLGAHTASIGLVFDANGQMPGKYRGGAFVAQHGSWNRSSLTGYKIVFVPFLHGKPAGRPETFIDGFIADTIPPKVYGRPVGLLITKSGSLLITDDASNTIWCVKKINK